MTPGLDGYKLSGEVAAYTIEVPRFFELSFGFCLGGGRGTNSPLEGEPLASSRASINALVRSSVSPSDNLIFVGVSALIVSISTKIAPA